MISLNAIPVIPAELGPQLTAFRGVPLSLSLVLDRTRTTLTGASALHAEIRQSVTDETPLARATVTTPSGAGPFSLNFTGAETNVDLDGAETGDFALTVYSVSSGEVDVIFTGPMVIRESGASAAPPAPAVAPLYYSAAQVDGLIADLQAQIDALTPSYAGTIVDDSGGQILDDAGNPISDDTT